MARCFQEGVADVVVKGTRRALLPLNAFAESDDDPVRADARRPPTTLATLLCPLVPHRAPFAEGIAVPESAGFIGQTNACEVRWSTRLPSVSP